MAVQDATGPNARRGNLRRHAPSGHLRALALWGDGLAAEGLVASAPSGGRRVGECQTVSGQKRDPPPAHTTWSKARAVLR